MAIRSCSCVSEYQDKKHGKGMRVKTEGKKPNGAINLSCTICGAKSTESGSKGKE